MTAVAAMKRALRAVRVAASCFLVYALILQGAVGAFSASRMIGAPDAAVLCVARIADVDQPSPSAPSDHACDCAALCGQGGVLAPTRVADPLTRRALVAPDVIVPVALVGDARRPGDPKAARAPPSLERDDASLDQGILQT